MVPSVIFIFSFHLHLERKHQRHNEKHNENTIHGQTDTRQVHFQLTRCRVDWAVLHEMTHREGKLRKKDRQKRKEQLRSDIITGDRECRRGVRLSHCRLDPLVAPVNGDGAVCGLALKPRHHAAACLATDAELLVCLPSCRSRRFQGYGPSFVLLHESSMPQLFSLEINADATLSNAFHVCSVISCGKRWRMGKRWWGWKISHFAEPFSSPQIKLSVFERLTFWHRGINGAHGKKKE